MPLLRCVGCSTTSQSSILDLVCTNCGSALILSEGRTPSLKRETLERRPSGVWRYRELLPSPESGQVVSLGEGGTPLLRATNLGAEFGLDDLLIKDETRNPTGSFFDRGSTVLVSLAKDRGIASCTCETTGNLGASVAAYCAKAGIDAKVRITPNTDRGKLYQMIAYGANIETSPKPPKRGRLDDRSIAVTAGNPYILEGEKTTCFEIIQDLGWKTPDAILVPVGTGGHLSMFWRAIRMLEQMRLVGKVGTRLVGVQFAGFTNPLDSLQGVKRLGKSERSFTELEESDPIFMGEAVRAMKESGGNRLETTVEEAIEATGLLARTEGIFAEPAAASVVASLRSAKSQGLIRSDETVVCVITGAGLKDTKAIARIARATKQPLVKEEYSVSPLQVGTTKLEVLRRLSLKPHFGYELWRVLLLGRRITTASVYQHLGELESMGLVRKAGVSTVRGRERILYELTRKGTDLLRMAKKMEGSRL